jgi:hypothetical protein
VKAASLNASWRTRQSGLARKLPKTCTRVPLTHTQQLSRVLGHEGAVAHQLSYKEHGASDKTPYT